MTQDFLSHPRDSEALSEASMPVLVSPSICPSNGALRSQNACVLLCLQPTPCLSGMYPIQASFCVSPPPPHVLPPLTETLASAKEENVEIHQTLDQTLLELNNL